MEETEDIEGNFISNQRDIFHKNSSPIQFCNHFIPSISIQLPKYFPVGFLQSERFTPAKINAIASSVCSSIISGLSLSISGVKCRQFSCTVK